MRKLESYKTDYGYQDDEGGDHKELTHFLQEGILDFCGCGNPEGNLMLIHDLLTIRNKTTDRYKNNIPIDKSLNLYEIEKEELKKYVHENWEKLIDFFWYVMSEKNIMEHGSSIPGWVNDINFMEAIKKWKEEYEEKEKK